VRKSFNNALLITAAICFTVGGLCMKSSVGLTRMLPSLLMSVLFLTGAALQALAMRNADMSAVYVSVLGLESLLAFAVGVFALGEAVSAVRLCAIALIAAGVVLLHR
jgi:multidrug transporter EmrE-like cation transporter